MPENRKCPDENENSDDDQVSSCDADEKEKEETLNIKKELEKFKQMMISASKKNITMNN